MQHSNVISDAATCLKIFNMVQQLVFELDYDYSAGVFETQELGIRFNYGHYEIVDHHKWLVAKIKYGL